MPKKLVEDTFNGYMSKMRESMGIGRNVSADTAPSQPADLAAMAPAAVPAAPAGSLPNAPAA
jgi:hypothetical protein